MEAKSKILLGVLSAVLLVVVVVLCVKYVKYGKNDNQESNEKTKETYEIRENFPQTSSVNLLYTDQNGNLGATSDVGITNLTVNSNAQVAGTHTISGKATMNGGTTMNGGATINGGMTVDTLNATSSITSPTITNLLNEINSLKDRVASLESKLTKVTYDSSSNTLRVNGNIQPDRLVLKDGDTTYSLSARSDAKSLRIDGSKPGILGGYADIRTWHQTGQEW